MEKFEELVTCPICCDRLKSPRMLPCQHTLCFNCLGRHVASKMLKRDENGLVSFANTNGGFIIYFLLHNFSCFLKVFIVGNSRMSSGVLFHSLRAE